MHWMASETQPLPVASMNWQAMRLMAWFMPVTPCTHTRTHKPVQALLLELSTAKSLRKVSGDSLTGNEADGLVHACQTLHRRILHRQGAVSHFWRVALGSIQRLT